MHPKQLRNWACLRGMAENDCTGCVTHGASSPYEEEWSPWRVSMDAYLEIDPGHSCNAFLEILIHEQ